MSRYIDADALLKWYDKVRVHELEIILSKDYHKDRKDEARIIKSTLDKVYLKVQELKSEVTDVEEVRHGEWVENPIMSDSYSKSYYCNLCKRSVRVPNGCHLKNLSPYCHCGAKMDGKEKEI